MRFLAHNLSMLPHLAIFLAIAGIPATNNLDVVEETVVQGIATDDSYDVETLVRDIFIKGNCDNVENISSIGHSEGIGFFNQGSPVIGMERGIILSTGPISNAEGPNDGTDVSGNFSDNSGDVDLDIMATDDVRDAVGIEFDFVPLDSIVTFRYVFASEEYCEFVGSIFNDVFGFFISGPGIEGEFSNNSMNVALVPGTEDFVEINSINHVDNSEYYNRNELYDDALHCNIEHVPSPLLNDIQYDGFTDILTAVLRLTPCETYHIRLVVSDVGDNFYDSAVFLEAGSFNLGGAVRLTATSSINDGNVVNEGCTDGAFIFERQELLTLNDDLEVDFFVSPASTATSGLDFNPLPQSITIPAGETFVTLPVDVLNDQLSESFETLILELDIPCACYEDNAQLVLADPPSIAVNLPDAIICSEESTILSPIIEGGVEGEFSYLWSTNETTPTISISTQNNTSYSVTVTDVCGNTAEDSATVGIFDPPTAFLSGMTEICEGDQSTLQVEFTGDGPWRLGYTIDQGTPIYINNITEANYELNVNLGGTYEIYEIFDANCLGIGEGAGIVDMTTIDVQSNVTDITCEGGADGAIEISLSGGIPPYTLEWANGLGADSTLTNLSEGTYTLMVSDAGGCTKEVLFPISSPNSLGAVSFDCEELSQGVFDFTATGGMPPYSYSIDGSPFSDNSLFEGLQAGEEYELTIRDANGCEFVQQFLMPNVNGDIIDLPESLELKLGQVITLEPQLFVPEELLVNIRWTPTDYLSCADCLRPEFTAIEDISYSLRIIDEFGCTDEAVMSIVVNPSTGIFIPNAFSPNEDGINDRFSIYADELQIKEVKVMRIFDRWGSAVFEDTSFPVNDSDYGWDGRKRGKLMNAGLYVYYAEIELLDGTVLFEKGEVLLVK